MRQKIAVLALILNIAACSDSGVAWREGAFKSASADTALSGATADSIVISTAADKLPNITVPTANLYGVPVTTALQAILFGTDVSLTWDAKTLGTHPVSVMNLKGDLSKVVEKICDAANVSCGYRDGSIELSEKTAFVAGSHALIQPPNSRPFVSDAGEIKQKNSEEILPDPIIIDKDGSRPVSFPKYLQPIALTPDASKAMPTHSGANSMKYPSGASVDNEMIQKDFSRAFGDMSQTSGSLKEGKP